VYCITAVIAELELAQVGLEVLLADGVVCTAYAALYKAPEAFDSIRVDVALDVDLGAVIDPAVLITGMIAALVPDVF